MQLSRRQIVAYVAVAAVVVAVGVRYVVAPKVAESGGGTPLVLSTAAPGGASPGAPGLPSSPGGASAPASPAAEAVVYVCGAVRSPGVVRLPQGSRVADALALAGGATSRAELAAVNLAAKVADGQQILVPEQAPAGTAAAAGLAGGAESGSSGGGSPQVAVAAVPGAPVNINTASLAELDALQGVGPSTAQKIIDYRTANGPFASIDDIKNVSGIGDAKFAAIKDSIAV